MLAVIIPILNSVLGGVIKPFVAAWADYERMKLKTNEAGFEKAAEADAAIMQAALAADVQMAAMKVQLYGSFTYRAVSLVVGGVCAVHFSLVILDTILASKFLYGGPVLGVPSPPGNYATWEWAIISSFFIVHVVNVGKTNVASWLNKDKR